MSLQIKNASVSIDKKKVVKDFSLTINPGELHVLMGPNGSGKSSLSYALAGHPEYELSLGKDGVFSLDKVDLIEKSPDERAKEGLFLAFQYPVAVAGLRIERFLWESYKLQIEARGKENPFSSLLAFRRELEKHASKLGLDPSMLKRGLHEGFSGGEKKRLEILQLLVLQPKYAILDETDSGLDIDAIKTVAAGIKESVKESQTGVLLITHYQRILKYLEPDRVHLMIDSQLTESGGMELVERLEREGYNK